MPFGLISVPATFQRVINHNLKDFQFFKVYLDDIFFIFRSEKQHLGDKFEVLIRIGNTTLQIKLKGGFIGDSEVRLLGHVVSSGDRGLTKRKYN